MLIVGLVIYPLILFISSSLFKGMNFYHPYQWIILGIVIALINYILDLLFLKPGLVYMNNFLDLVVDVGFIFLSQYVLPYTYIKLTIAFVSAIFINIVELFEHFHIIKSNISIK